MVPGLSIAVLAGGDTGEREVSLGTGRAVIEALADQGHRPQLVELSTGADGPCWALDGQSASPLELLAGALAGVELCLGGARMANLGTREVALSVTSMPNMAGTVKLIRITWISTSTAIGQIVSMPVQASTAITPA